MTRTMPRNSPNREFLTLKSHKVSHFVRMNQKKKNIGFDSFKPSDFDSIEISGKAKQPKENKMI